ncbi:hypothetical protein BRC62_03275, partial [Halobacteriales archaeon QH_10_67_13]
MTAGWLRGAAMVGLVVCLVGLVAGVAVVGTTGAATPDEELNVSIDTSKTDVWVTESFEVRVTAEHVGESTNRYGIEEVRVVDSAGTTVATRTPFAESIVSGQRSEFVFDDVSVSAPGSELEAIVEFSDTGRGSSSSVTKTARTPVEVSQPDPVTTVTGNRSAEAVSLTVGNPNEDSLRRLGIELERSGDANISLLTDRAVVPTLEPGETRELIFDVQGAPAGTYSFDLALTFETDDGSTWERTRSVTAEFAERATGEDVVGISNVSVSNAPNGVKVTGSVFTDGDAIVRNVELRPADVSGTGPARPAPEAFIPDVVGDETETFELTATLSENRSTVPLRIEYALDGVEQTTTAEVSYTGPRNDDPVQLTNLNVNGARVSGEVANTGEATATGVTVGFASAENITGGDEFFVGSIDSGGFQPLESI